MYIICVYVLVNVQTGYLLFKSHRAELKGEIWQKHRKTDQSQTQINSKKGW